MRARKVRSDWPLVYVEVTTSDGATSAVRIPRDVRRQAYDVEHGRATTLDILRPASRQDVGGSGHNGRSWMNWHTMALSLLGVFLAAFFVYAATRGHLRRWRQKTRRRYRNDGRHYQLTVGARASKLFLGVDPEPPMTQTQREQAEDRAWGIEEGVLEKPPPQFS